MTPRQPDVSAGSFFPNRTLTFSGALKRICGDSVLLPFFLVSHGCSWSETLQRLVQIGQSTAAETAIRRKAGMTPSLAINNDLETVSLFISKQ